MYQFTKKKLYLVFLIFLLPYHSYEQDNSPYYLSSLFNEYIEYLINSDQIDLLHPLNQPYTTKQLYRSFDFDSTITEVDYWTSILQKDLLRYSPRQTDNGIFLLGTEGGVDIKHVKNSFDDNYYLNLNGSYNYKNILAYYGYTANTEYLNDSIYFGTTGKLQNKVFGRASTAYLKYNSKYFNIFYGRLNRNYGVFNEYSLIRSNNPYSYDHFSFEVFNRKLKYSFSATRLDDKYAYDSRDSIPESNWFKRYISFHRLEISFSRNFKMALTESILYGGQSQDLVPAYINPFNIFYLSKMSDREGLEESDANSLTSLEVFIKPARKIAYYAQFLLDDMDFTEELREQYPDRIGLSTYLAFTDLLPKTQLKISYSRISTWTYNSFYTYGNYTYFGKSLGFPQNGFQNISLDLDVFRFSKVFFSIKAYYQCAKEQDLETHFDPEIKDFPGGVGQNLYGSFAEINYIPNIYFNASLKIEYNYFDSNNHISGNQKNFLNLYLSVKANGVLNVFSRKSQSKPVQ